MNIQKKTFATRRAFGAGVLALVLMGTAACSSDAAPEPGADPEATSTQTAPVDNHGGGDDELEQTVYEVVEATSPTTATLKSGSETVEVRLLGLADIKAEGETDTAFASQEAIDTATEKLESLLGYGDLILTADPAADDADADGTLLRYVDVLEGGSMDRATGEKADLDVALALIHNQHGYGYGDAGALGVYDPDLQHAGLERMDRYVDATRVALDPRKDDTSEVAYFDVEFDNGDPVWEDAELVVSR